MPLSSPPPVPRRPPGPEPLRRRRAAAAVPPPPAWRRRALNYLLIGVIVLLVAEALFGDNGFLQRMHVREAYAGQLRELDDLRQENQRLRQEIRRLREDPVTIEMIARRELGFARPDEVLFIVRDVQPVRR